MSILRLVTFELYCCFLDQKWVNDLFSSCRSSASLTAVHVWRTHPYKYTLLTIVLRTSRLIASIAPPSCRLNEVHPCLCPVRLSCSSFACQGAGVTPPPHAVMASPDRAALARLVSLLGRRGRLTLQSMQLFLRRE